ncbi:hypothetical protein [Terrisporobacter sp.]
MKNQQTTQHTELNSESKNENVNQNKKQDKKPVNQVHLSKEEREELINKILHLVNNEKCTLKEVAERLDLKTSDNVSKKLLRAGYKRNKETKLYEKIDKNKIDKTDKQVKDNNTDDNTSNATDNTNEIDILKKLEEIEKRLAELEGKEEGIFVTNEKMDYQSYTVRIDKTVMNDLLRKIENEYTNVSKSYVMTVAFKEFIERH